MGEYVTGGFKFADPAIRLVEERDIGDISNLFRLNYGETYLYPDVYDGRWVKRSIYGEDVICLVLEEKGEVLATGAVVLDYGDHNDQIGEMGRLVVHPERAGSGVGKRIMDALFEATGENVEFAFSRARTENLFGQTVTVRAGFTTIGFLPYYLLFGTTRESAIFVAKLHGNGAALRSDELPEVIPEVAPLARHVLSSMSLPTELMVVNECPTYQDDVACAVQPLDRASLARLVRIEYGRVVEPLLFGSVSLEHGFSHIRRRNVAYLVALDENQHPIGALGYQEDRVGKAVKGTELVAGSQSLRGPLCGTLLREAERLGAEIVEVNVSAYDARLQRTFYEQGFRPVAYAPAMVFHGTHRLDVIKMLKLNVPYQTGDMKLTEPAKAVVSIVEREFLCTDAAA